MQNNFLIYNASAGSGKTYTLTRAYLEFILAPKASFAFSQILALTFTNKAVNEMKQRILSSLQDFASLPLPKKSSSLFLEVSASLEMSAEELQKKSSHVLQQLLHNYAFFEVSTIDKFNHRLIRTFAKDLKLPQNFEVQLDTELILSEAVDQLLDRVGTDPLLTEILVAFALEKIADDKSWDLSFDIKNIGKLLFNDNHNEPINDLKDKKLEDFKSLKKQLKSSLTQAVQTLKTTALHIQKLISSQALLPTDFSRSSLPNFLDKIVAGGSPETSAQWLQEFDEKDPCPKSKPQATKDAIEAIRPAISKGLKEILAGLSLRAFYENAYKNLLPLNLINALQFQIKTLCEKRDYLPISEFNKLIKGALSQQSVPFIYERLGEQYRHYFIDEFQDTSALQWQNLKPLIENALVSEDLSGQTGSLLLVGDAKQSIYRWRGGSATQFIALCNQPSLGFTAAPSKTIQLPKNYRSLPNIVAFNNLFFKYISAFLAAGSYRELYENGATQLPAHEKGGYVSLRFLEVEKQLKKEAYCAEVLRCIETAQEKGFQLGELCVLTRKNTEGALIASYLLEQNIPVISSESLLLSHDPKVEFLVGLINYLNQEADPYLAYPLLEYLGKQQSKLSLDEYITKWLHRVQDLFIEGYRFDTKNTSPQDLYAFCVRAIDSFNLWEGEDAYLIYFLDTVLEVAQKKGGGASIFLAYWEEKKGSLSIQAPEGVNAIQILSIHKSKGLEFPVVIYPFVETPIYDEKQPKIWLPVQRADYSNFNYLLLNKNERLGQINDQAKEMITAENELLALDAFNLLYVAFTRAEKALFVVGARAINDKGEVNTKQFSGVLIDYLMHENKWEDSENHYSFGSFEKAAAAHPIKKPVSIPYLAQKQAGFPLLLHPETQQNTAQSAAKIHGQQLHLLLEGLAQHSMEKALENVLNSYPLAPLKQLETAANAIVEHPLLAPYYKKGVQAANEKEIFGTDGLSYRPDRLVFEGQSVSIIDYKTGREKQEDHNQINHYGSLLTAMNYHIKNKILVYISKDEIVPIFVL